jgi:hypothetical protein
VGMGINRKWKQCGYNSQKEVKAILLSGHYVTRLVTYLLLPRVARVGPLFRYLFFYFHYFTILFVSCDLKKNPFSRVIVISHCAASTSALASLVSLSGREGSDNGMPRRCQGSCGLAAAGRNWGIERALAFLGGWQPRRRIGSGGEADTNDCDLKDGDDPTLCVRPEVPHPRPPWWQDRALDGPRRGCSGIALFADAAHQDRGVDQALDNHVVLR